MPSGGDSPNIPENTTQTTQILPPPFATPYINQAIADAQNLYQGYSPQANNLSRQISDLNAQINSASGGSGGLISLPDGRVVNLNSPTASNVLPNELGGIRKLYDAGDYQMLEDMGYGVIGGGSSANVDSLIAQRDALQSELGETDADLPDFFPGQTYVDFSPETERALAMITNRAEGGSATFNAGNEAIRAAAAGEYLNSNPYLDSVIDSSVNDITQNYLDSVVPQLNSTFARSGRFGSGAQLNSMADANEVLADSIGDTVSRIRYQNYDNERNRQMQAAQLSPTFANYEYADADRLLGVGSARESLSQARLQDEMDRFYFYENQPQRQLDDYIARIGALTNGYSSGTSTSTNPAAFNQPQTGGISGGISGALGGLSLASSLTNAGVIGGGATGALAGIGGPLGLGIAGVGLLGGLFG